MEDAPQIEVRPIHTAVPGRARFSIPGLRGSKDLGRYIESHLPGGVIDRACANIISGNLLVFFNPSVPSHEIAATIRAMIARRTLSGPQEDSGSDWHVLELEELLSHLGSRSSGLSEREARQRLSLSGPNTIGAVSGRASHELLFSQFQSLPVALLAAGAGLSLLTGGLIDAGVILSVIGLNAGIGYGTERHAEQTINALSDGEDGSGFVVRDGAVREIPLAEIVPGDVLDLRAGLVIPGDGRLISSDALTVSEALLTGESLPVEKRVDARPRDRAPLAERTNLVFRGTLVTGGSGRAMVVATGRATEIGRIQSSIGAATPPQTPLQNQLDQLGRQLVAGSIAACGGVFAIGLLRGNAILPMLKTAISLAVAAVPEGLPALATTTLAIGIGNLRRQGVLIRRLPAVEGLSAIQMVCFDKTGTLTLNRMAVARIVTATGIFETANGKIVQAGEDEASQHSSSNPDLHRLLELGILCSDAEFNGAGSDPEIVGSPTEAALLNAGVAAGLDIAAIRGRRPRLSVKQRTDQRRYMKTTHKIGQGRALAAVKGSPTDVLAMCKWVLRAGRRRPLSEAERAAIESENSRLADAALRVLGVAYGVNGNEMAEDLVWVGLIAMHDPVRPDARRIIRLFHQAGISTSMITGDQPATSAAIAQELGLGTANGERIHATSLDHIGAAVPPAARQIGSHIFSRVTPAQKLKVVEALQQAGFVVAMTGDGVNDAPALRAADIGVALGGGTDAARQTADVILLGDELEGLVIAIENGRATYENIRRAIDYLLATNLAEIALMVAVTATGIGQPLTPMQLLWVNLVTDVLPALGLALEPPSDKLMERPPRNPSESIISASAFRILARDAAVMAGTTMAAQLYASLRHGAGIRSGAVGFSSLVFAQLLYALRHRAARPSPPKPGRTRAAQPDYLAGAITASFGAQAAALYVPGLRQLCGGPIDALDLAIALAAGAASFALTAIPNHADAAEWLARSSLPLNDRSVS